MLSSRAKRELKIDQRQVLIDSMEIGIPSGQQILVWGERRLPNGKKVGRVKNSKTVNYKRFTPFRDGLFCERIFGPVTSLVCACGKKQPHTKVTFCEKCEVPYIDQRSRRYRLGYISLVSSVTHIWYLKGRPSYLSLFLGKRKKTVMSLAYCNAYLVEHTISRTDYNAQGQQNEALVLGATPKLPDLHEAQVRTRQREQNISTWWQSHRNACRGEAPKASLKPQNEALAPSCPFLPCPFLPLRGTARRGTAPHAKLALPFLPCKPCSYLVCAKHQLNQPHRCITNRSASKVLQAMRKKNGKNNVKVLDVAKYACRHERSFARICGRVAATPLATRSLARQNKKARRWCLAATPPSSLPIALPLRSRGTKQALHAVPCPFGARRGKKVQVPCTFAGANTNTNSSFVKRLEKSFANKSFVHTSKICKPVLDIWCLEATPPCRHKRAAKRSFATGEEGRVWAKQALNSSLASAGLARLVPLAGLSGGVASTSLAKLSFARQHLLTKRYSEALLGSQVKNRIRLGQDKSLKQAFGARHRQAPKVQVPCPCLAFSKKHASNGLFLVRNKNFLKNKRSKALLSCQSTNNFIIPKKKTNILAFETGTLTKSLSDLHLVAKPQRCMQNKALHCTKQSFVHTFASHPSFAFGKPYNAKIQSKKGTLYGPCTDLVPLPLKDLKHTNFRGLVPSFLKSLLNKAGSIPYTMAYKASHATYIRGQTFPFLPNFISNFYLRDAILNFFTTTSFFEDRPLLAYCSSKRWLPLQNVHKFMAEQTVSNLTASQNTTLDENKRHTGACKKGKAQAHAPLQNDSRCTSEALLGRVVHRNSIKQFGRAKLRSCLLPVQVPLPSLVQSVSGTIQNSAQLELTTIQEILSYTGGGALERLLSRYKTQSFEKYLFSESEILRNIYQKRTANRYKVSIAQGKGSYKTRAKLALNSSLACPYPFAPSGRAPSERSKASLGPSVKGQEEARHVVEGIRPAQFKGTFVASPPSASHFGESGNRARTQKQGAEQGGKTSFACGAVPLRGKKGQEGASNLTFFIKPSNNGELHYKDLQKKQLLRLCRRIFKNARRLKIAQLFSRNNRRPEWMVLSHLPVLPPDLRPILQMSENVIVASDLNNLYQRVIYRNNRHYRLRFIDFHLVSAIQRLVQDAVDRLIENGKAGSKPYYTPGGRVLKSLSDILKGKKGRFRLNLLGKRVDFSGRSVIVVSPSCKIHECGLPKNIALELYHYFLLRQLMLKKRCSSIVIAKKMIKERSALMWDMLRDLIYHHPVLLNRAPTLHRLGIQAFQPKLVLGNAILLHPLVCSGFNADFDGDQMGVHLPLCFAARAETWDLLWSRNNLLSPATGQPMLVPSQDMVLGFYYMTQMHTNLYRHQKKPYKESAHLTFGQGTGKTRHWSCQKGNLPSARASASQGRPLANATKNAKQGHVSYVQKGTLYSGYANHSPCEADLALYHAKRSKQALPALGAVPRRGKKGQETGFAARHALYVPLFQHYSTIDFILQAFQKGDIFLHTPVWLKWDGKLENEGIPQKPLEVRVNNYGYTTSIYSSYKCINYGTKKQLIKYKAKRNPVDVQKARAKQSFENGVQNEALVVVSTPKLPDLHPLQGKDRTWWHNQKYVPWSKSTSEAWLSSRNSTSLYAPQSEALLTLADQAFDLIYNPSLSLKTFIKSVYYTNKKQRSRFIRTTVGRVILNKVMLM